MVTLHDATGSTVAVLDISQREFDALVPAQQQTRSSSSSRQTEARDDP